MKGYFFGDVFLPYFGFFMKLAKIWHRNNCTGQGGSWGSTDLRKVQNDRKQCWLWESIFRYFFLFSQSELRIELKSKCLPLCWIKKKKTSINISRTLCTNLLERKVVSCQSCFAITKNLLTPYYGDHLLHLYIWSVCSIEQRHHHHIRRTVKCWPHCAFNPSTTWQPTALSLKDFHYKPRHYLNRNIMNN